MIGYAGSGAFLGLAYFDLYYTLIAIMVICKIVCQQELAVLDDVPGMTRDSVNQVGNRSRHGTGALVENG